MAGKYDLKSLDDIIKEAQQLVRDTKRKVCRKCSQVKRLVQSGFCEECYIIIKLERDERNLQARIVDKDKGYVRIYHPETGKLVLEHRYVMEKLLGRTLKKGEVVLHKNLNNSDNRPENLMLGFKGGTPFESIVCNSCGTRGEFTYDPYVRVAESSVQSPEENQTRQQPAPLHFEL